jgi:hypothetical protein
MALKDIVRQYDLKRQDEYASIDDEINKELFAAAEDELTRQREALFQRSKVYSKNQETMDLIRKTEEKKADAIKELTFLTSPEMTTAMDKAPPSRQEAYRAEIEGLQRSIGQPYFAAKEELVEVDELVVEPYMHVDTAELDVIVPVAYTHRLKEGSLEAELFNCMAKAVAVTAKKHGLSASEVSRSNSLGGFIIEKNIKLAKSYAQGFLDDLTDYIATHTSKTLQNARVRIQPFWDIWTKEPALDELIVEQQGSVIRTPLADDVDIQASYEGYSRMRDEGKTHAEARDVLVEHGVRGRSLTAWASAYKRSHKPALPGYDAFVILREKGKTYGEAREILKVQGIHDGRIIHGWELGYSQRGIPRISKDTFSMDGYIGMRRKNDYANIQEKLLAKGFTSRQIGGFESQYTRKTASGEVSPSQLHNGERTEQFIKDRRKIMRRLSFNLNDLNDKENKREFKAEMKTLGWEDFQMRGCEAAITRKKNGN